MKVTKKWATKWKVGLVALALAAIPTAAWAASQALPGCGCGCPFC